MIAEKEDPVIKTVRRLRAENNRKDKLIEKYNAQIDRRDVKIAGLLWQVKEMKGRLAK